MKVLSFLRRLFCCTALPLLTDTAAAAGGELDVTFNPSGTGSPPGTLLDHFPGLSLRIWKFALWPDGRIVSAAVADKTLALSRWSHSGGLDPGFGDGGRVVVPLSGWPVLTGLAVQSDARLIVTLDLGGVSIRRFLPDGSPDPAFGSGGISRPPVTGRMGFPVPLSDGKLLAGGSVVVDAQSFAKLWRLLPDGSLDPSFGSGGGTALPFRRGSIDSIAVQPDGKIVTAGTGIMGDDTWVLVSRFQADGNVDPDFGDAGGTVKLPHPLAMADHVYLTLSSGGKIIVSSVTHTVGEDYAQRVDCLLPNGSADASFGTGGHALISTLVAPGAGVFVQADGKIVVGGAVTEGRLFLARLLENGRPDVHFGPDGVTEPLGFPDGAVTAWGMLQQPDRKILIGGELFESQASGMALARYNTDSLPGSLSGESPAGTNFPDGGTIALSVVRGSPATPEATIVLRNTGTARLTGLSAKLSGTGSERFKILSTVPSILEPGAFGFVTVRFLPLPEISSTRVSLIIDTGNPDIEDFLVFLQGETQAPEAVLSLLDGLSTLEDESTVDFGPALESMPFTKVFTIKNAGNIDLLLQGLTFATGGHPEDFTVVPQETGTLAPGASTSFSVTFRPSGSGVRTAKLRISSTDTFHPPLEINLTGRLAEGIDAWRFEWFGAAARDAAAADSGDPDGDGIPNLLEYAAFSNPVERSAFPGGIAVILNTLEYTFTRRSAALEYLNYSLEWSDSLQAPWNDFAGDPVIVEDDGVKQVVKFTLPVGDQAKRFVRLRVSGK